MALFERNAPASEMRRALRGRPTLRRQARDVPDDRMAEMQAALSQDIDPTRFKSLYRDRLKQMIDLDQQAEPLAQRDALSGLLNAPYGLPIKNAKGQITGYEKDPLEGKRDLMRQVVRRLPGQNSVASRFDPRDPNSAAVRQFGSLYRNF